MDKLSRKDIGKSQGDNIRCQPNIPWLCIHQLFPLRVYEESVADRCESWLFWYMVIFFVPLILLLDYKFTKIIRFSINGKLCFLDLYEWVKWSLREGSWHWCQSVNRLQSCRDAVKSHAKAQRTQRNLFNKLNMKLTPLRSLRLCVRFKWSMREN